MFKNITLVAKFGINYGGGGGDKGGSREASCENPSSR